MTATPHTTDTPTTGTTPAHARRYGPHYTATAALTVPEVAALIMSDLIMISADPDPDTVFPARIRFAADVFPADNLIHIWVFGLTDAELAAPYASPDDGAPCPVDYDEIIADTVATDYGWNNPHDPGDRRFRLQVSTMDEDRQATAAHRIGTTVTTGGHAPADPAWIVL